MVTRFDFLKYLAEVVDDALVIMWGAGEGGEWWHLRPYPPSLHSSTLGYTTAMGIGLALALPHRRVVVIDTDGGLVFNTSVLCTLGNLRPPNLKIFVIDNECYESIGGMPTATAGRTDLAAMAKGAGIEHAETTGTLEELKDVTKRAFDDNALYFIVAKIEKGTRDVPTLFLDGIERKYQFVRYIEETENIHIITPGLQHAGKYDEAAKKTTA